MTCDIIEHKCVKWNFGQLGCQRWINYFIFSWPLKSLFRFIFSSEIWYFWSFLSLFRTDTCAMKTYHQLDECMSEGAAYSVEFRSVGCITHNSFEELSSDWNDAKNTKFFWLNLFRFKKMHLSIENIHVWTSNSVFFIEHTHTHNLFRGL